jgi:predicted 3-demethylubiquinone-9 3-methyltransferase (glyoxalase superfamily)
LTISSWKNLNKFIALNNKRENYMQKITPFLWFDIQTEEAVNFYTSIFKNSKIGSLARYNEGNAEVSGRAPGSVMVASFQLEGEDFTALNGGPLFKFNNSISFYVWCKSIEEIDELWSKLSHEGQTLMVLGKYTFSEKYGWVQDKYGVSWQLILGNNHQKIAPCLMFAGVHQGKAEEAINFYVSLFKDSHITMNACYENVEPELERKVIHAEFLLNGQAFVAMDSAVKIPFTFNEAVSFVVNCSSQDEVDYYWENLSKGGDEKAQQCGWLKDKYGVSWQVVPTALFEMMSDKDTTKAKRVTQAMLQMKKIDLNVLKQAYDQK